VQINAAKKTRYEEKRRRQKVKRDWSACKCDSLSSRTRRFSLSQLASHSAAVHRHLLY